ncbi:MAG TPA: MMPL family transporter [Gemmatimonadaceae bacterium]|nr:MMPL family transporter [Gemmatimonadaceae bacterium]
MRFPRLILGGWLCAAAVATAYAPGVVDALTARGKAPDDTESARADALVATRFAEPAGDVLVVTVESPAPFDSGAPALALHAVESALAAAPWATRVTSWRSTGSARLITADHRTTALFVALSRAGGREPVDLVAPARALVAGALAAAGPAAAGVRARITGEAPLDADLRATSERDSRDAELRLAPVTLIVLVAAFGALVAAALPLAVGFLSIWISLAVIALLARVMPMSVFVMNITTMLGLGVGIDYSLLVVTRFREELAARDASPAGAAAAAARAAATAGRAVITSGLTVMVGFAALLFTPLVETRSLGVGGLVVVGISVALATTFLPALLALLGHRIDWPRALAARLAWIHTTDWWRRWARAVIARPIPSLAAGLAVIALVTWPVTRLTIGLPARHWWPAGTESAEGAAALDRLGLGAVAQPIRVTVELPPGGNALDGASLQAIAALGDSLRADPRVHLVRSVAAPDSGIPLTLLRMMYADSAAARARMPGFLDAYLSRDGRVALLDVVLRDSVSLTGATRTVRAVRRIAAAPQLPALAGADIAVGGFFAGSVDLQDRLMARFPLLIAMILAVTAAMLAFAFRSVLVPVKAVVMNLLSVAGSFGLFVWVFQLGHGARFFGLDGPSEAIFGVVPVLVFAITFGLSMDYEVFLLARIKEGFDATGDSDRAIEDGVRASAGVITSAALIMILVFGAFAFARVFVVQVLGFGLAAAVLLDATVIRMVIVPALMTLAGAWNWWPGGRSVSAGR